MLTFFFFLMAEGLCMFCGRKNRRQAASSLQLLIAEMVAPDLLLTGCVSG